MHGIICELSVEEFMYFAMDDCEVGIYDLDRGNEEVFPHIDDAIAKYGRYRVVTFDVENGHICLNVEEK